MKRVLGVAKCLHRMYEIFAINDKKISPDHASELVQLSHTFMALYSALSEEAVSQKQQLWKLTPKFHLLMHLLEWQACEFNPAAVWTYSDEDIMGLIQEVGTSCHINTMEPTVLSKWLVL